MITEKAVKYGITAVVIVWAAWIVYLAATTPAPTVAELRAEGVPASLAKQVGAAVETSQRLRRGPHAN